MDIIVSINGRNLQKIYDEIKRDIIIGALPTNPINRLYLYSTEIKMVVGYIEINSYIKSKLISFDKVISIIPRGLREFGLKRLYGPFTYSTKVER